MDTLMAVEFPVPPIVQAAPDGVWERAQVLDGDPGPVLEAMCAGAKYLGVEVMWPGHAFVGTGWLAQRWPDATVAVERAIAARPMTPQAGLAALIGDAAVGSARFVQIGAVNAWASVGAESLWKQGETYSPQRVEALLDRRPDLAMTCPHPVAVEFGLSGPAPTWVAFHVSRPGGPVDRARLHEIVRHFTA
ncbi:MAG TPA: hypothetical protein VF062_15020 [Candidatus Limnocylindrales bacterium]